MVRRVAADVGRLHEYVRSKTTPGACAECPLPRRNAVHVEKHDPRLAVQDKAQEEHRRRIGDHL